MSEDPDDQKAHSQSVIPEEEEVLEEVSTREEDGIQGDHENGPSGENLTQYEADDYESDAFYHDTVVSHEDREDAFDYEHFFLHSAMGTINQQRLSRRVVVVALVLRTLLRQLEAQQRITEIQRLVLHKDHPLAIFDPIAQNRSQH